MDCPRFNPVPQQAFIPEATGYAELHPKNAPGFRCFLRDDSGQDLIEYALVAALVGVGAIAALKGLSTHTSAIHSVRSAAP
jgi:pilus assembly protein Flp/PilA